MFRAARPAYVQGTGPDWPQTGPGEQPDSVVGIALEEVASRERRDPSARMPRRIAQHRSCHEADHATTDTRHTYDEPPEVMQLAPRAESSRHPSGGEYGHHEAETKRATHARLLPPVRRAKTPCAHRAVSALAQGAISCRQ